MSAFGSGSTMTLGLRLAMKDDTQGVIGAATSAHMRFRNIVTKPITVPLRIGRSSLALARDVQLGLAPIIAGIDRVLERGGALEVQQKAFESLTGRSGQNAVDQAKRLQAASSGMLGFGEAMALANRALSSGMGLDQLAVAIEFIGKKSVATGKDARQAMDTVITGLIRGSTLFLDDFGILVDGVDAVKRSYDAINGKGAFESLGPAAQKAETVRQAITEMRGQMDKIGISGRETVFIYTGIKTAIGDAVDKLVLAAAKSDAVKSSLIGVRETLTGITQHFEGGGSLGDILFGKGKSGGIFGLLKAGMLDAGEALGRGMIGGALVAIGSIPTVLSAAGSIISDGISFAVEGGITRAIDAAIARLIKDAGGDEQKVAKALGAEPAVLDIIQNFSGTNEPGLMETVRISSGFKVNEILDTIESVGGVWNFLTRAVTGTTHAQDPVHESPPYEEMAGVPWGFGLGLGLTPGIGTPAAAEAAAAAINESLRPPSIFESLVSAGKGILSSGVLGGESRAAREWVNIQAEYQPEQQAAPADAPDETEASPYRLTAYARRAARRRIGVINSQLRNIRSGGAFTRQMALRDTAEEVARLRGEGNFISRRDRGEIFDRMLGRRQDAAAKPLNAEWERAWKRIDASDARRASDRESLADSRAVRELGDDRRRSESAEQVAEGAKSMRESVQRMEQTVTLAMGQIGRFMQIMAGAENELARVAGKK